MGSLTEFLFGDLVCILHYKALHSDCVDDDSVSVYL